MLIIKDLDDYKCMQRGFMSYARNFQCLHLYFSNRSLEYDFLMYIEDVFTIYF